MKSYIFTTLILVAVCSCDSSRKKYDQDEVLTISPHAPMQQLFNYTTIGPDAWSSENYEYDFVIDGKASTDPTPLLDVHRGKLGTHYTIVTLDVTKVVEGTYPEREFVFGHTYSSYKDGYIKKPNYVGEFRVWAKKMSVGYLITHIEEISNQNMEPMLKTPVD